jgi:hypothetical protein
MFAFSEPLGGVLATSAEPPVPAELGDTVPPAPRRRPALGQPKRYHCQAVEYPEGSGCGARSMARRASGGAGGANRGGVKRSASRRTVSRPAGGWALGEPGRHEIKEPIRGLSEWQAPAGPRAATHHRTILRRGWASARSWNCGCGGDGSPPAGAWGGAADRMCRFPGEVTGIRRRISALRRADCEQGRKNENWTKPGILLAIAKAGCHTQPPQVKPTGKHATPVGPIAFSS